MAKQKTSGIYKITNNRTGEVYIGQSKNIEKRWAQHQKELKKGTHHNRNLQKHYNRGDTFSYSILEKSSTNKATLNSLEERYISNYNSFSNGYNQTRGGRYDKVDSMGFTKRRFYFRNSPIQRQRSRPKYFGPKYKLSNYKLCPSCKRLYTANLKVCPGCGSSFDKKIGSPQKNKFSNFKLPEKYFPQEDIDGTLLSNSQGLRKRQFELAKKYNKRNFEKIQKLEKYDFIIPKTFCPICRNEVDSFDNFCIFCGNRLNMNRICPNCHTEVGINDKFCFNCGSDLSINRFCPNCHAEVGINDNFCFKCGRKL